MPSPRSRLTAALLVLALGAAGCSGDSGGDDASNRSTTTEAGASSTTPPDDADNAGGEPLERYADYETENYADPSHWVCRPELTDDICHGNLDSTTVAADGSLTVVPFERAENPPVDCFYLYPTISRDKTRFSDWEASPDEEGYVTLQQAARLASVCRVFTPVYRQNTLTSLTSSLGGKPLEGQDEIDPYQDVLDAFRTYLAEDNGGRGIVLLGHSQGASMVKRLLIDEVDPHDDVRALLVGAYVAGSSLAVPEGEVVGGELRSIPLCTEEDQAGCVVTWSTYRGTTPPPPSAIFGRVREGDGVAGCINPAAPTGGPAPLDAAMPANATASILTGAGEASGDNTWVEGAVDPITTPFVTLPGLLTGECVSSPDGFHYLEVTVQGDPSTPRADDIPGDMSPEWGLHLVDVNVVMGDVASLIARQAKAHTG